VGLLFVPACSGPAPWMPKPPGGPHPQEDPTCEQFVPGSSPFPADLPATETVSAGTMRGAFAVSSTGEATYSLPLLVPPGRAGMQPSLSVRYDSSAGDGPLGKGFSIAGLSAITRCP